MTKIEPVGYVHKCEDYTMSIIRATKGEHPCPVAVYTEAQIRQLAEACAALLENQKYMVLNPLRTFTPDEVCRGKKETALYLADGIRRLIKEMLG